LALKYQIPICNRNQKRKHVGALTPFSKDQANVFAYAKDRETLLTVLDAMALVNAVIARSQDLKRSNIPAEGIACPMRLA
jgi:hypothetical protein